MTVDYRNTIHSHFALPLLRAAAQRGYAPELFLGPAGLHPDVFEQPKIRLTSTQYNTIVKRIWITLGDESAGLGPRPTPLGFFELMCEMALNERTLRDVFNKIFRSYMVFVGFMAWRLEIEKGSLAIGFRYVDFEDQEHILTEWTLLAWHRFACWAADQAFPLQQVSFNYPKPDYSAEYDHLFGCPCLYSQPMAQMRVDARYLGLPVLKSRDELKEFIRGSPGVLLARPVSERHFKVRIRRVIMSSLEANRALVFPSIEDLARRFSLTAQTLRRRLKAERTSYHDLKNDIRRDLSIDLLSRKRLSVQETSVIVGYNESSAFSRAFKEWTGMSPNAYRAEAVSGPDSLEASGSGGNWADS